MTEFEVLTLLSQLRNEGATHATAFFTVWSAFLLVAFFVAKDLSRTYAVILSALYTFYLLAPTGAMITTLGTLYSVSAAHQQMTETVASSPPIPWAAAMPIVIPAIYLVAWATSILFLFHRRKIT